IASASRAQSLRRGEVVERAKAAGDVDHGPVRGDPARDARRPASAEAAARPAATDEDVAELTSAHVLLELRERRRWIRPGEATHRHDRFAGRELDRSRFLRAVDCDDPCRVALVRDEVIDERGRGHGGLARTAAANDGYVPASAKAVTATERAGSSRTRARDGAVVHGCDRVERIRDRTSEDRGGECDGVVGMDDPGHVAEDARRHEGPAAPEEIAGACAVRARCARMDEQAGEERDDRERDEPADLTDELAVEEAEEAGRAPK